MLTIDEVIERFDGSLAYSTNSKEICQYIADLLKELKERRKAPEIVHCGECVNQYKPTCPFGVWINTPDDGYCHWAERRTE